MSSLADFPGAGGWRKSLQQAQFRTALFFVDTDARVGGRRVALHEYPKRNVPYAEDMGHKATRLTVQGYLVWKDGDQLGSNYLDLKNDLITALEADGPGLLRLPLPYLKQDIWVMVQQYSVTESRERGGMCVVEMDFIEYGDPNFRANVLSAAQIMQAATSLEQVSLMAASATSPTKQLASFSQASPYYDAYFASGAVPSPVLRP